ncbi:HlyD family efflux transporter periplasmic adaptor subunit [Asaia krungthepensis]|uniref:Multidrug resistance efflux pump n=1 Tax=Asaia krungthepensis NRIC 0535 TaxID=1307925 RepID=A0ABQ0Q472_9PROT|nr:HlyD family efflux transporter periplasmic adaptor subunit [Asaia krungthepensis]GBQ90606.1 multidrug resistance efflux pump [Asaia krungthepensis NRIC 0535]
MNSLPSRIGGIALLILSLAACVITGFLVLDRLHSRPRTEDAYVAANIVHLAPEVSGRIVFLPVHDNEKVRRGQILYVIDPEPYTYRVQAARAQVEGLQAQIEVQTSQVSSQVSHAGAEASGVTSARARLTLAQATEGRLTPLARQGFVTREALDQARTETRSAEASLQQSLQSALAAKQAVRSVAPLRADLAAAQAQLREAERDLRLTTVRAPCDGIVTDLNIAAGEYATTGKPVFTLVDTEIWWAIANFRETQLAGLAAGQKVRVYAMSQPGTPITGTLESLNAGVVPDEGTSANGLPKVPRTLNWVRIAQRFPVRIRLDNPPTDLMRIGATVVVVVMR